MRFDDVRTMRQWIDDMPDEALLSVEHIVSTTLDSPEDAKMFLVHARTEIEIRGLDKL